MSFITLTGLNDVRPPEVHPEGRVPLCILQAKEVEKDGKTNIQVLIEIEDPHPVEGREWANMFHNVSLPGRDDDDEKKMTKLRMAKQFLVQFGIPFDDGVDLALFAGARCDGNITVGEYNNQPKNELKLDPLPKE